jgi:ferredoxin
MSVVRRLSTRPDLVGTVVVRLASVPGKGTERAMRITIDGDRCSGHGRCYTLAPDLFTDDDRGFGQVEGDGTVGPDQVEAARRAVRSCPERAIALEEQTAARP